jgi:hypothetical protein
MRKNSDLKSFLNATLRTFYTKQKSAFGYFITFSNSGEGGIIFIFLLACMTKISFLGSLEVPELQIVASMLAEPKW